MDAVRSLERVRPQEDVDSGHCRAEAEAIQDALENKVEKGPWLDLFVRSNFSIFTTALTMNPAWHEFPSDMDRLRSLVASAVDGPRICLSMSAHLSWAS